MSHDQLARLRQAVTDLQADGRLDRRVAMMFLLLAATGLRPSEALALRPGDVDVVTDRLRVERSLNPDGSLKSTKTKEARTLISAIA